LNTIKELNTKDADRETSVVSNKSLSDRNMPDLYHSELKSKITEITEVAICNG
jgi:hypothetical protein